MEPDHIYYFKFIRFTGTELDSDQLKSYNGLYTFVAAKQLCESLICCADCYHEDKRFLGSFVDLADGKILFVQNLRGRR